MESVSLTVIPSGGRPRGARSRGTPSYRRVPASDPVSWLREFLDSAVSGFVLNFAATRDGLPRADRVSGGRWKFRIQNSSAVFTLHVPSGKVLESSSFRPSSVSTHKRFMIGCPASMLVTIARSITLIISRRSPPMMTAIGFSSPRDSSRHTTFAIREIPDRFTPTPSASRRSTWNDLTF